MPKLVSTISGYEYPFNRLEEFSENGESLEVSIENISKAKITEGNYIFQRFKEFLPFKQLNPAVSLGEGNTPILSDKKLNEFVDIDNLLLKNETQNPTWSFKDRGSIACIWMSLEMSEQVTATISTGNMGNSISAYGAKSNIRVIVFVPDFCPPEKVFAMSIHGAKVVKIVSNDYSKMKKTLLDLSPNVPLRLISGNGPIRVEGYKLEAFEIYEQLKGLVPDYIAVPTSACGHIRGVFKGFRELLEAGYTKKLPKMIIVQAENNSPIVSAIKQDKKHIIPFFNVHTIAEAITTGSPLGGDELIDKTRKYDWLAEDVSEKEILESQQRLALSGYFVEPASATTLMAVKKLREKHKIKKTDSVVCILTGSGLKDMEISKIHNFKNYSTNEKDLSVEYLRSL